MNEISLHSTFANPLFSYGGRASLINFYEQVLSVAQQCPSSGGEAVFRAREIIRQVNDSLEYDYASVCAQMGIFRKKQITAVKNQAINLLLIPNPAKEQVQLILTGFKPHKEILITVQDLAGRLLDQKEIASKLISAVLNTASLSIGIYVVEVITDQNERSSTKLIIGK